jgi:hypothetical protein
MHLRSDGPAVWSAIVQRHALINSKLCLYIADNCAEDYARISAMNMAMASWAEAPREIAELSDSKHAS